VIRKHQTGHLIGAVDVRRLSGQCHLHRMLHSRLHAINEHTCYGEVVMEVGCSGDVVEVGCSGDVMR
jgi:hypothetical protein